MKNIEDIVNEINEHNEKARTDRKFDINKKYVFCYEKLLNDDRAGLGKNLWIEKLKELDGRSVIPSNEEEGIIEGTMWSIAEKWCKVII